MSGNYPFLSARKRGGSGGSGAPAQLIVARLCAPAKAGALASLIRARRITSNAPAFAGAHAFLIAGEARA